jgi:hypothetical protein
VENISLEINFHDHTALKAAGLQVPQPAAIQCLPGAIPATGDVVTLHGVSYPSGERARFQVVSRAHLFGGDRTQRIQLNLQLLVLHQP